MKERVVVMVPAYNEELTIAKTLKAILTIVPARDVFVINDGSKDKTNKIASKYISHVLTIKNSGKAHALNQ